MNEREFGDLGARIRNLEVEIDRLRRVRHENDNHIQAALSASENALEFAKEHKQGIESNARVTANNTARIDEASTALKDLAPRVRSLEDSRIWAYGASAGIAGLVSVLGFLANKFL